ncbi:hypothetical protein MAR_005272 [Mya arenaria]|uniref:Sushi domain-containing protein n=1 Tax=Mya arenaria TaxID=6604 RepID=A0ABY7F0R4_MYAAR|nr:hypothetical protein MAR_005272 [Mya arenaria]
MLKTPKKISPIDSAVRYECLEGYTHAPGSDSVICQEDVCRQEDAVVDNGVAIAGAGPFVAGSVIQFGCNAGFISAVCNGSNVLVCQPDGSWTRRGGCMPECYYAFNFIQYINY